jgi:hypothetical protein
MDLSYSIGLLSGHGGGVVGNIMDFSRFSTAQAKLSFAGLAFQG